MYHSSRADEAVEHETEIDERLLQVFLTVCMQDASRGVLLAGGMSAGTPYHDGWMIYWRVDPLATAY